DLPGAGGADGDRVPRPGRVAGVAQEVEQELLDVRLNARERGEVVGQVDGQVDPAPLEALPQDRQGAVGGVAERDLARAAGQPSGEAEHPAEDPPTRLDRALDLAEVLGGDRRVDLPPLPLLAAP